MNKLNLILSAGAFAALVFARSPATASATENFNLTAYFGVTVCNTTYDEDDKPQVHCTSDSSASQKVSIALDHCNDSNGATICWGEWSTSRTIDGHQFNGSVAVFKRTDLTGIARYTLWSGTRNEGEELGTNHFLELAKNTVTDLSVLLGSVTKSKDSSGNQITYLPAVAVASTDATLKATASKMARKALERGALSKK